MKYVLALDQGTTSTRALLFDKNGRIFASAQREFEQIYPRPGWVEHSPQDIIGSTVAVIGEALARAGISAADVAAMGVTNQRETTFVWNRRTGVPVCNAIVWQCRRTADICEKLKRDNLSEFIYKKTGLIPDAYFSATKLKWILDNVEGAREQAEAGELLFGTVDTFILWRLSRGKIFATDYTNASRTMLFNIHTLQWDAELCRLFDIPMQMLPEVKASGAYYGTTDESYFGAAMPVCGVVGDQQSALFGQLCLEKGSVKNTYGTGCFLLMNTGDCAVESRNGLVTTLGASVGGKPCYVLEGSVFVGGALVQWLRDEMRLIVSADESESRAREVEDSGGVYVVPAFTGLGAPYWDSEARGTICGITRGTRQEHIIRASLEAIAYEVYDLVKAMERDADTEISALSVDGGASKNNFLMSFQADLLNCEVVRGQTVETTALGAAYLAGLQCGFWKDVDELKSLKGTPKIFAPTMEKQKREELIAGWHRAVKRTLG